MNPKLKRFMHGFSNFDLFGQKVDFTYKNQIYFGSVYGSVFSLFTYVFLIFQATSGYRNISTRNNPSIDTMDFEDRETSKVNLLRHNLTISFGFVSDNRTEYLYDPSYFDIEANYISQSKNNSYDVTSSLPLNVTNCNNFDFSSFNNIYERFHLSNALCLKAPESQSGLDILTDNNEFFESYLKFSVKVCMGKPYCQDHSEILTRLRKLNLYMYIVHDYFDGRDTDNPIKQRLSFDKWTFDDIKLINDDTIYFGMQKLHDFKNLLFLYLSEPVPIHFATFNTKDITRTFKYKENLLDDDGKLIDISFKAKAINTKIVRKYNTIIDMIANLGGLFNVMCVIGNYIFGYINRTFLDCKLINDHFNIVNAKDFELENFYSNERKSSSGVNIKKTKDELKNPFLHPSDYDKKNFVYEDEPQRDVSFRPFGSIKTKEMKAAKCKLLSKHKQYKYKYSMCDILLSLCLFKSKKLRKKNEIYSNCRNIISKYLDIMYMINIMQEFKVVRNILFDSLQNSLIDYFKKPILRINSDNQNQTTLIYRRSHLEDTKQKDMCEVKENLDILNVRYDVKQDPLDEKILGITNLK